MITAPRPSWVVVPARDEAATIGACIAALARAACAVEGPVHVVVIDDGSTDATAAIAREALARWGGHAVLAGPGEGVGWARRIGFEHALAAAGRLGAAGIERRRPTRGVMSSTLEALIATTDADSTVAPDWLRALHLHLDDGHRVVAGDVLLDPAADPGLVTARAARLQRRLTDLPPDERPAPHPHFAGGNLAFAAGALRVLGPLPTPRALEDHAILERCRALGVPVLRAADVRVVTSARTIGRAPQGLADALALDAARLSGAHRTPAAAPSSPIERSMWRAPTAPTARPRLTAP